MAPDTLSSVAAEFLRYGERDYYGSSHLYATLAGCVAQDPELLAIASHGRSAIPNLFFGAVHYLLMRSGHDVLAEYFPSLHKPAKSGNDLFPAFRSFCIRHKADLIGIVTTRIVQTNEVSRCAYLYPAFVLVSKLAGDVPLAMVDIGASAGLHLLWDRYAYDYGLGRVCGDPASPVRITCELRGETGLSLNEKMPQVGARFAIDLRPVSPDNEDDLIWLDALIWPEHESRRELFHGAVEILRREKGAIAFSEGDAADILPDVLSKVPADQAACVYQTHIWRQLRPASRLKLTETLEQFGRARKIFFVSALDQLRLELFASTGHRRWTLANYEQHGRWLEWLESQVTT